MKEKAAPDGECGGAAPVKMVSPVGHEIPVSDKVTGIRYKE